MILWDRLASHERGCHPLGDEEGKEVRERLVGRYRDRLDGRYPAGAATGHWKPSLPLVMNPRRAAGAGACLSVMMKRGRYMKGWRGTMRKTFCHAKVIDPRRTAGAGACLSTKMMWGRQVKDKRGPMRKNSSTAWKGRP